MFSTIYELVSWFTTTVVGGLVNLLKETQILDFSLWDIIIGLSATALAIRLYRDLFEHPDNFKDGSK